MDNESIEFAKDVVIEIAKDAYQDAGKPIAKSTGEMLALVPRAIKAALLPLEKWIMDKEYNLAETQKLLADKLKDIPPEQIEQPEAYIAVPALQYITYCMDNDELRNLYANLLANSMNKTIKNGVHPGFVEIIKQLSPDEAKILKYISTHPTIPIVSLRYENNDNTGQYVLRTFSIIAFENNCENPFHIEQYFNNLIRLGLIEIPENYRLTDKKLYEPIRNHTYIKSLMLESEYKKYGYEKAVICEHAIFLSSYGKSFCKICV
jgi:hypothetical protein